MKKLAGLCTHSGKPTWATRVFLWDFIRSSNVVLRLERHSVKEGRWLTVR